MPRYAKNTEERWIHPDYRKAYCYRYQNGMVYTSINSKRQATGYEWNIKNKKKCLAILHDRLIASDSKTINIKSKTIKDIIKQFHRDKVMALDIKTQKLYKALYKQFLSEDFNLSDTQQIRDYILQVKNSLKLSENTIWKRLQRLRKIFGYAVELEWCEKNPVTKSMVPKFTKGDIVLSKAENINLIINYFRNNDSKLMSLMVEFAFITAMRIQEILDIEWTDIENEQLRIVGKMNIKRIIPLRSFPRAKEILFELRNTGKAKPFDYKNQQTPAKNLRKTLIELKKDYPEKDWNITFHTLRKTTINMWRNAQIEEKVRNAVAGHSEKIADQFYLADYEIEYIENEFNKLSK